VGNLVRVGRPEFDSIIFTNSRQALVWHSLLFSWYVGTSGTVVGAWKWSPLWNAKLKNTRSFNFSPHMHIHARFLDTYKFYFASTNLIGETQQVSRKEHGTIGSQR